MLGTRLVTALVLLLAGPACAPVISMTTPVQRPRSVLVVDATESADCLRHTDGASLQERETIDAVDDPELVKFLEQVPKDVRRTAHAAGIEWLLARLMQVKATGEPAAGKLDVTAMRLQVVTRISSLEIQLSSLGFEVGCMGRQMDTTLLELDRLEQRQQLVLTISSLVVGAVTGVGAGVWELADEDAMPGPLVLGVVGGSASAGLGIAGFVPRRSRVIYQHERNPLGPIANGTDPTGIYPEFVFRMLTSPGPSGEASPRDELLREWRRVLEEGVKPRDRELAEAILYGEGGMYDRDLIDVRERMLDALESDLDGIERDLELLYRFLALVLEDRNAGL